MEEDLVKLGLIQQSSDITTIPQGQIPLLEVTDKNWKSKTIQAINFLRCGCPTVQLFAILGPNNVLPIEISKFLTQFEKGENFTVGYNSGVALYQIERV